MKKKRHISITPASVELKICTSNISDICRKKKSHKTLTSKKTETNTHLSTSIKKLQLQKIIYQ